MGASYRISWSQGYQGANPLLDLVDVMPLSIARSKFGSLDSGRLHGAVDMWDRQIREYLDASPRGRQSVLTELRNSGLTSIVWLFLVLAARAGELRGADRTASASRRRGQGEVVVVLGEGGRDRGSPIAWPAASCAQLTSACAVEPLSQTG